ncbi:MAG: methyltransferase domain-containing protein [Candidatus Micrarchaeota archaeon]|nr:methyltransferase domain-containing protein [Candidatus Micrarchaeota archaeon]
MFIPEAYKRLKRGPQVILPKDIGMIIAYTGIGKGSECLDAGTGSGWLAVSLARICRKVTSYETREDFIRIAERNRSGEGLDNLIIKNKDFMKTVTEKDVDLVTLDMPNSNKAVRNAHKALKPDGYICGYLPHTEQVRDFVAALNRYKFRNIYTIEVIVRDMLVREEGTRPSTKGVWHTAYLVFAQKQK